METSSAVAEVPTTVRTRATGWGWPQAAPRGVPPAARRGGAPFRCRSGALGRTERIVRLAVVLAAGVALAGCGGAASSAPSPSPHGSASAASKAKPAARRRLVVRTAGHLPAPVQLPAVTATRGGLLVAGGLD